MKNILFILAVMTISWSCTAQQNSETNQEMTEFKVNKTEQDWKEQLSPEQYYVLREKGTERPGTGEYNLHFEDGIYKCAACDSPIFSSESKFDAHCGWPSFDKALNENTIVERLDNSHGMVRTEILCANCGGHLGHLFNDGPTETGLRYCINSVSLDFDKKQDDKTKSK